jgi:peptidyl-prolyl cis-trans isomerase A (cyclophilin A)
MMHGRLVTLVSLALLGHALVTASAAGQGQPTVAVVFETSAGSFELALDPDKAPKTVANFLAYVDEGFYTGTLVHRVIQGFVIQGGGFETGMKKKPTRPPVENESDNGLKNGRGTISMARSRSRDSATSQFFINVAYNAKLDRGPNRPGYAVFGRVTSGLEVVDQIVALPTTSHGQYSDVPEEDVVILSATRKASAHSVGGDASEPGGAPFVAGEHYVVLEEEVATRDASRIEVVEAFSYGCTHCFQIEPLLAGWRAQQPEDVEFRNFHAVWNPAMELYARAFHTAKQLGVAEAVHHRLFAAIVAEHRQLDDEHSLAGFFAEQGVDEKAFSQAWSSPAVSKAVTAAAARTRSYNLASVPEIVVNGKYRVDPMRAGGRVRMLEVVDHLVERERTLLKD